MIVEQLHSQKTANKIDESDLQAIRELSEKYGYINILQELNEKKEYRALPSSKFNATGGAYVKGLSGALQSIPSFAISLLISPTLTALAAVGALSHRIRTRWEDTESWRNRLMPGFWADNLANPGNYSIPHRIVDGTGKVVKGVGTAVAGATLGSLAWPKLKARYNEMKQNSPSWLKKLIGIGAAAGLAKKAGSTNDSSTDSSTLYDDSLTLTPEEVKNIDFKEYYVTLSNGEVLRFKADSESSARALAKQTLDILLKEGAWYSILNEKIERKEAERYIFHFDDGEICYSAGKDREDALKCAMMTRTTLCNQINNSDQNLMKIDPLKEPTIDKESSPKRGVKIPLPSKDRMVISTNRPNYKKETKKKLKYPIYSYEGMSDYGVRVMNCQLHFPAYKINEVMEMVRVFYTKTARNIFQLMENCANRRVCQQFSIAMNDGDRYRVYAIDEQSATETALKLQKAKLEAAFIILREIKNDDDLENFTREFGNMIKGVKSKKAIPPKDYKEYKESRKVFITRNPSNENESRDDYQPYEI